MITVNGVIKDCNALDCDSIGGVDIGLSDGRVVEGEIGGRGVGDEDSFVWQESWEATVGVEEKEVREREAPRDSVER